MFELLFGWHLGLLDVAKESWESQLLPVCFEIECVSDMHAKIDRVGPIVRQHPQKAQREQQRVYNLMAQTREYKPEDHVLLLVPSHHL